MDLHVPDAAVARLEAALAAATESSSLELAVELAWHLRQRDTRRADRLSAECHAQLRRRMADDPNTLALMARISLIGAECAVLSQDVDRAMSLAHVAEEHSRSLLDHAMEGDAHLAQVLIAQALGDRTLEIHHCRAAVDCYKRAGDAPRERFGRAAEFLAEHLSDSSAVPDRIKMLRACSEDAVACQLDYAEGVDAFQHGHFAQAIPMLLRARDEATRMGMVELAVRAALSVAASFTNLGDHASAAEIGEVVLARARELGWPRALAQALGLLARIMIQTGEPERALELTGEASHLMEPLGHSRYAGYLRYTAGDACLALGQHERALEEFEAALEIMRALGQKQETAALLAVRAQALSRLGRVQQAIESAAEALEVAREVDARLWVCEALRSLAEIHANHPDASAGRTASNALRLLDEALLVVEGIGGHHERSELLAEISRVHEGAGDLAKALRVEREARTELGRAHHARAANLALASQARHHTEMARLEAAHQKSVAAAEAERATQLADWNARLEQRVAEQVGQLERLMRLKRFLSPKVAEMILAGQLDDPLATRRREVTIMFVDLRGFTAFSDAAAPEDVLGVLREYHAEVGRLTEKYEGTIEHFAGDGVMLIFNDPAVLPDPALAAVRMAIELRDKVATLAKSWERLGYRLHCGVGIAQGYATIGTIGFAGRHDYGVVGHVNNLAARLCSEAGRAQVLVSQRVYGRVEARVSAAPVGDLRLKGFNMPVPAYEVFALKETVSFEEN